MSKAGFTNGGYYTSKLNFGGGTVSQPVTGIENLSADRIVRNLTISSTLFPWSSGVNLGYCHKIICSDTLTLNEGGVIDCSGDGYKGHYLASSSNTPGFEGFGTVGGSGAGGNSTPSGDGSPGASYTGISLGGNGGSGGSLGSHSGGSGGYTGNFVAPNNMFQASIRDGGLIFAGTTAPPVFTYNVVSLFGGCGGGGMADVGGSNVGAGGIGGGVVYVAADTIVMNGGRIIANGQNTGTNGGGGGGGGVIVLVYNEIIWNSSSSYIDAGGGGAGGAGSTDGSPGLILLFSDSLVASYRNAIPITGAIYDGLAISAHSSGSVSVTT